MKIVNWRAYISEYGLTVEGRRRLSAAGLTVEGTDLANQKLVRLRRVKAIEVRAGYWNPVAVETHNTSHELLAYPDYRATPGGDVPEHRAASAWKALTEERYPADRMFMLRSKRIPIGTINPTDHRAYAFAHAGTGERAGLWALNQFWADEALDRGLSSAEWDDWAEMPA